MQRKRSGKDNTVLTMVISGMWTPECFITFFSLLIYYCLTNKYKLFCNPPPPPKGTYLNLKHPSTIMWEAVSTCPWNLEQWKSRGLVSGSPIYSPWSDLGAGDSGNKNRHGPHSPGTSLSSGRDRPPSGNDSETITDEHRGSEVKRL